MKVAVVTYPSSMPGGVSLASDVELVRASILYADQIELISPGAVMLASVLQMGAGDDAHLLEVMASLDDDTLRTLGGDLPDNWRELLPVLTTMMKTPVLDAFGMAGTREELVQGFEAVHDQLRDIAERMLTESGAADLLPGFEAGIVTLSPSGFSEESSNSDDAVERWVDLLRKLLHDRTTRLLFDDRVGDLVRAMVDEGDVMPNALTMKHAGEAAVGSGLVARLPAFPQVPLNELLDLRRDLSDPLTRYRAAVSRLAGELTARSFDPEAVAEIDDLA